MENKTTNKAPLSPPKTHTYEHYDKDNDVLYKVTDGKIDAIIDAPSQNHNRFKEFEEEIHISEHALDLTKDTEQIEGYFNQGDCFFYKYLIMACPEDATVVEIGSWLGKSSSFFADNKKPNQKLICVDTWRGSTDELKGNHTLATKADVYEIFKKNMGDREYTPIQKPSKEASLMFKDKSLDAVFIDAQHTYEAVKEDLECWLPKIKDTGYICGHDVQHQPVQQALNEVLKDRWKLSGGLCWYVEPLAKETV